jgi:hypothetical protein
LRTTRIPAGGQTAASVMPVAERAPKQIGPDLHDLSAPPPRENSDFADGDSQPPDPHWQYCVVIAAISCSLTQTHTVDEDMQNVNEDSTHVPEQLVDQLLKGYDSLQTEIKLLDKQRRELENKVSWSKQQVRPPTPLPSPTPTLSMMIHFSSRPEVATRHCR